MNISREIIKNTERECGVQPREPLGQNPNREGPGGEKINTPSSRSKEETCWSEVRLPANASNERKPVTEVGLTSTPLEIIDSLREISHVV
ncbi:hypothetical protein Syun_011236 [Stephania yunnanensis]|uniref:Uncharacterized protein n=1 Tax=Stephania yunnanensis TaxID=152371 RepID=A0AAP0PIB0_9MAGN